MQKPPSAEEKAPPCGPATAGLAGPHGFGLCAFVLLVALTVDFSTDTPYLPGRWLGPFYHLWPASQTSSAICAVVLCLLASLPVAATWRRAPWARPGGATSVALRLLPLPALLFASWWSLPHLPRSLVIPWYLGTAAAAVFFVLGALRGWAPVRIAAAAALVGIVLRVVHFSRFPIDVGGDMLPLTRSALDSLLAGHSPYGYHKLPELLPLTYYPLTWLAYLPPYLLHIDLRVTNVLAELAIAAALLYAGRGTPAGERGKHLDWTGTALVAWSFVFLLPSAVFFDRITTAPVAWALLAWTVALAARASRWDWLLLGLLAAATPLAALPALFLLLTWRRRLPWRRAVGRAAAAAGVALLFVLPFYLWSPRGFVDGAILWFNDLHRFPGTKWHAYQTWQRYVGFGGLFWRAGAERWLVGIQWILVLGLAGLYLRQGSDRRLFAAYLASAFVAFMVFNSVHWPYFYQPALWCGMVALATKLPVAQT